MKFWNFKEILYFKIFAGRKVKVNPGIHIKVVNEITHLLKVVKVLEQSWEATEEVGERFFNPVHTGRGDFLSLHLGYSMEIGTPGTLFTFPKYTLGPL